MKLSIVIPTHNRPHYLERALKSIYPSSFLGVEVIVVNDGSLLDYSPILSTHRSLISRYIVLDHSKGVSHARNQGISIATGEWILFLDDDDELAKDYIETLITFLKKIDTSIGLVWGNVDIYKYKENSVTVVEQRYYCSSLEEQELEASKIGASFGLAIRRVVLNNFGGFDDKFSVGEDTELIIRLMSNGVEPAHINTLATKKHDHNEKRLTNELYLYSDNQVYEEILERYKFFIQSKRLILENLIEWSFCVHILSCNISYALAVLKKSITYKINLGNIIIRLIKAWWFRIRK